MTGTTSGAHLSGEARARYVQQMFRRIAGRYDLMNRVMTAGQDVRWRQEVIRLASLPPAGILLDIGAGTGDLARLANRLHPTSLAIAADFTIEMMHTGRQAHQSPDYWTATDALLLPFAEDTFDAIVSGFLLRNVHDLPAALSEQYRVLKPFGRLVCLDTSRPPRTVLSPLLNFYLQKVIPTLGKLITGEQEAYQYLPESTQRFLKPGELAELLLLAGFKNVGYSKYMFSTIAIHWAEK